MPDMGNARCWRRWGGRRCRRWGGRRCRWGRDRSRRRVRNQRSPSSAAAGQPQHQDGTYQKKNNGGKGTTRGPLHHGRDSASATGVACHNALVDDRAILLALCAKKRSPCKRGPPRKSLDWCRRRDLSPNRTITDEVGVNPRLAAYRVRLTVSAVSSIARKRP